MRIIMQSSQPAKSYRTLKIVSISKIAIMSIIDIKMMPSINRR
jgi:hypothetical protein